MTVVLDREDAGGRETGCLIESWREVLVESGKGEGIGLRKTWDDEEIISVVHVLCGVLSVAEERGEGAVELWLGDDEEGLGLAVDDHRHVLLLCG